MRIGIDYITALGKNFSGDVTYTRELVKSLSKIDSENNYYLYTYIHKFFLSHDRENDFLISKSNFHYRFAILPFFSSDEFIVETLKFLRKELFLLSNKLNNLDLFHLTNPTNYYRGLSNYIVTIHDLAPLYTNSDFVKRKTFLFFEKYISEIIKNSQLIICVSNFTKNDILKRFDVAENKIRVIYEGANETFRPTIKPEILIKLGIKKKYLLSVGRLQPRKNLLTLLKVYALLPDYLKEEYDLVLVGSQRDHDYLNELKEIISKLGIEKNLKIVGWVSDQDLAALYSQAYIFVYLSFLEGFGLPVLESLYCGRPVLISNNSSLPEVAGNAGFLVKPDDIEQILETLKKILNDSTLVDKLTKEIPEQIKHFSWGKAASETLAVYKELF